MNEHNPIAKNQVKFMLNDKEVYAHSEQTIWQAAHKQGVEIPHLCYRNDETYRADGNCRACMVQIEGERTLAASCQRKVSDGMVVTTATDRVKNSQKLVMELLLSDHPDKEIAHDDSSHFWQMAETHSLETSRFPSRPAIEADNSHPAIAVNMDACIQCGLCVRACREVQVNDVIGMAGRGADAHIIFDFGDDMGASTCVGCGECVQACPTGALLPKSLMNEDATKRTITPDKQVDSVCPYCGVGCQLSFQVKDDKIVGVESKKGPANLGRLCVKGRYGFDYIHNKERLTKPLIRREDVPKKDWHSFNPSNPLTHFREASWQEALDTASEGLNTIKSTHGGAALSGFGSAKGSNEEAYLFQKLIRTGFQTNNVDHCTRLCHASSVAALLENIGSGAVTASFSQAKYADAIIVIGANPTVNHPVAATFIKNAAQRGAELFVLDPRAQALDRYATKSLNFKPGSDVSLLNALINVIISEELYDRDYVNTHTEGFEQLAETVKYLTPEAMSPICGIPAEDIRLVARKFSNAPAGIIFWGMGISQHTHGTDNSRCLISLALLTGNIGKKGAGLHPLRGQNNVQGASDAGLIPMFLPDYQSVSDPQIRKKYEAIWQFPIPEQIGLTVVEITNAAFNGDIKGMYIMGENPAMSDPDQNHARAALENLDCLVVQDIFPTETAAFADVILPASAFPEKTGTVTNTDRRVQLGRQAVPPPGNAKQDYWIIQEIATRMGLQWSYQHPKDIFAEMRIVMPSLTGITWERLEKEDAVTYPCIDEHSDGQDLLFTESFPTKSGLGKFTPAEYTPPAEEPDDEYPFVLSTGRLLEHWHTGSMTRRSVVLDEIEPVAEIHINPKNLRSLGGFAGTQLQISTRRGVITLAARLDPGLPDGMVFIPFCFDEAPANMLTNSALDPFGKIPELKFSAANIKIAE